MRVGRRKMGAATLRRVVQSATAAEPGTTDAELLRRFADQGDQSAFAALVARHTGLVLGVCRRTLAGDQDAEDACQAVFLILARKAKGGRWQSSIANWLYTTARRVSGDLRRSAAQRTRREGKAAVPESVPPIDRLTGRELLAVVDEELDRLSAIYREPLLLYFQQELTRDEIARRLGVPAGTVKIRLERGRKKLAAALTKRGILLSTGLLALMATSPAGASPPRFIASVVVAATGSPPPRVAALAEGVAVMGLIKRTTFIGITAVGLIGLGLGLGTGTPMAAGPPDKAASPRPTGPPAATDVDKDSIAYGGQVLGPYGKPVAGAELYVTDAVGYLKRPSPSPEYGTSGPDGRFAFTVPASRFPDRWTVIAAAAPNLGPGWMQITPGGKRERLTIRLAPDDVPITGQIVDLQGKPIPNVTLTVLQINAAPGEDIDPWLAAVKAKAGDVLQLEQQYLSRFTVALAPKVTTDADGRFKLIGIGRNRLVRAQLDGPAVASQQIRIVTRPGKPMELVFHKGDREYGDPTVTTTYYGSEFRHAAAPTKPVTGVVRDKDTKKPLVGVTVQSEKLGSDPYHGMDIVQTTTDAAGRYRLIGLPKGPGSKITIVPAKDQPYLCVGTSVPDSPGFDPVTIDIELKRGVWIEGKVTDKATGRPVQASVEYYAMADNPNLEAYPGFYRPGLFGGVSTKVDGTFRVVGMAGAGLLGVYYQRDPYLRADERDDEFGTKERLLETAPFIISFTSNFNAIARVDPPKDVESVERNVTVDPGRPMQYTVLGPDGKPLAGTRTLDFNSKRTWAREPLKGAEFGGYFNPRRPLPVLFQFADRGLVGIASPPKEKDGPVPVWMEAGATASGRLVGTDGKPRPEVELRLLVRPKGGHLFCEYSSEPVVTDAEGRFRTPVLVGGCEYELRDDRGSAPFGDGLKAGTVKDLGDVRVSAKKE